MVRHNTERLLPVPDPVFHQRLLPAPARRALHPGQPVPPDLPQLRRRPSAPIQPARRELAGAAVAAVVVRAHDPLRFRLPWRRPSMIGKERGCIGDPFLYRSWTVSSATTTPPGRSGGSRAVRPTTHGPLWITRVGHARSRSPGPSVVGAEEATLSCVGAGRGRYSRILPRTCGRWSPSEMPSRRELLGDLQRGERAWLAL